VVLHRESLENNLLKTHPDANAVELREQSIIISPSPS
jgi:hypothetical protein